MDLAYKKELNKREQKLKDLDYSYSKKMKDIKYDANNKIEKHRFKHRERATKEISEDHKRWDHIQDRLTQKKGMWEREINHLEAKQKGERDLLLEKHMDRLDNEVYTHNKNLDELDDSARESMLKLKEENRQAMAKEKGNSRLRLASLKRDDETLEDQVIRSYSSFNQQQKDDIAQALKEKRKLQQQIIGDMENKNYKQIKTRQELQKTNLDKVNEIHNETIREREEQLLNKINEMERSHQETLLRLKTKNELEINDLKTSYGKRKEFIDLRSKDPFYKMDKLQPKIKDMGSEYTVSLEIPEHEARFVNLTGIGKKLRLTTTRNFQGIAETEEGGLNRSARSEMVSQEYPLDNHILPRKITQVYEDGMLIFKVPKN